MKLYELDHAYLQVAQMMEDGEEGLEDTLESIEGSIEEKYENIIYIIRNAEAMAEAYKKEAESFTKKQKVEENKIKSLKEYVKSSLLNTGKKKVQAGLFAVSIRNNAQSVDVVDQSAIPEKYFVPKPSELSKKAILEDLKEGKEVKGASLKRTQSVIIK